MGSKKKDLQLVFSLQYMSSACNDKSNMVGMFDIPATTLNWDVFKSYLLAHSGTPEDDLRVSYLDGDNREIPIDDQADFAIALYLFRQRARLGEVITIKLDRSESPKMSRSKRYSNSSDVQTQVNVEPEKTSLKTKNGDEKPPEWFSKYMKQFKTEMVNEIAVIVAKNATSQNSTSSCHHSRKTKAESSYKRSRKGPLLLAPNNEKETTKKSSNSSHKLERKLDSKLEKLENKAFSIRLRKVALARSSDSDVGKSSYKSRSIGLPISDNDLLMDAVTTSDNDTTIPHMTGGESYMQQWEVTNSGKLPWTDETELRYAWGSTALNPSVKRVKCPALQPGEKGVISVVLEIPETPGNYECYWHFHHNGRRFGHWLGCYVIVDEPIRASALKPCTYYGIDFCDPRCSPQESSPYLLSTPKKVKHGESSEKLQEYLVNRPSSPKKIRMDSPIDLSMDKITTEVKTTNDVLSQNSQQNAEVNRRIEEVSANLNNLVIETNNLAVFSDSDNQSVASIPESNSSSTDPANEYVLVDMNEPVNEEIHPHSVESTSDIEIIDRNSPEAATPTANAIPDLICNEEPSVNNNASTNANLESLNWREMFAEYAYFEEPFDLLNCHNRFHEPLNSYNPEIPLVAYPVPEGISIPLEQANFRVSLLDNKIQMFKIESENISKGTSTQAENADKQTSTDESSSAAADDSSNMREVHVDTISFKVNEGNVTLENVNKNCKETTVIDSVDRDGFAYVHYDGQKIPMPCKYLSETFLATAEQAPNPNILEKSVVEPSESSVKVSPSEYVPSESGFTVESSHCSAMASSFSEMNENQAENSPKKRLFVFPQSRPGFEIVYPEYNNTTLQNMDSILPNSRQSGLICKSPSENSSWSVCSNAGNEISFYNDYSNGSMMNLSHEPCHSHANIYQGCQFHKPQGGSPSCMLRSSAPPPPHCMHCCDTASWVTPNSCHVSQCGSVICSEAGSCQSPAPLPKCEATPPPVKNDPSVHILPETVVTGATNLANSALNTARNVLNMIVPNKEAGCWKNGHWISHNPESNRENALRLLSEMGFVDRDLNATLLARYNDNIERVISSLCNYGN